MRRAFTIIELLVVISIIGILVSFVTITYNSVTKRARDSERRNDLHQIKTALVNYSVDNHHYPDPGPDLESDSSEGDNWIPGLTLDYIKTLPKDPKQAIVPMFLAFIDSILGNLSFADLLKNESFNVNAQADPQFHMIGEQNIAVILFKFSDQVFDATNPDPETIITPAYLNEIFFTDSNSLDAYVREASYGKAWLAPFGAGSKIFGWYTLGPIPTTTCAGSQWMAELNQQIDNQYPGTRLSDWRRIIQIYPFQGTGCWANQSNAGLTDSYVATGYHFPYGDFDTSTFLWFSASQIGSKYFGPGAVRHEFMHAFTPNGPYPYDVHMNHEDALKCGSVPLPASLDPGECSISGPGIGAHYTEVTKERFSWFNSGNVVEVTSNGTYTIEPYATTSNNPKVLKIMRDPVMSEGLNVDYYITYRYPAGLDHSPSPEDMIDNTAYYQQWKDYPAEGVVIRNNYRTGNAVSHQIDVNPGSQPDDPANPWDDADDFRDAILRPSESFVIPIRDIMVTTVSVDPSEAVVNITFPAVGPTPSPTPSPTPPPSSSLPSTDYTYLYVITSPDFKSFILWAQLENLEDNQIYNKSGASCKDIPPLSTNYNYCVTSD
jgi:prepilin-type N-terminal cleavage/methylation domain-containing protein